VSPVRQIINPFDQSVLTEVEDQTREQAIAAIAKARNAFDHGDWQHASPEHRAAVLNRVADLLEGATADIARTETLDTG
jgi:betaine-aldehyde dehydrogenase